MNFESIGSFEWWCGAELPLTGAVDQAFQQSLQFVGRFVAVALDDVGFLPAGKRTEALGKDLSAIGQMHQHPPAIVGILHPIDERIGDHPIDHLGQGRMVEKNGVGEIAHRMALTIGEDHQDAPLLDGDSFFAESGFEVPIYFPIGLSKQISEVIANDGFPSGSFGHDYDFALRN